MAVLVAAAAAQNVEVSGGGGGGCEVNGDARGDEGKEWAVRIACDGDEHGARVIGELGCGEASACTGQSCGDGDAASGRRLVGRGR